MTPLLVVVYVASTVCAFAWVASLVTHDTSWVDRAWSIVPIVYLWVFASFAHLANARLDIMAGLVTVWGARLTFNFARKGGYSGVEDYRWAVLRSRMTPRQFQLFNVFFVVLYQNFLLVLITLPALTAYNHRSTSFGPLDVGLASLFLACTLAETVADQQQWDFQCWKQRETVAGREASPRFAQTGLFRYSRHPAFFFEQTQWWVLFLLGGVAADSLLVWTVLGPALLTLLFVGSTSFTEKITLARYPEYVDYQRRTSAIVPWFPRASVVRVVTNDGD